MLIGVLSDSHGHVDLTLNAIRLLEIMNVSHVIHCGDIGSPEIIGLFATWPTTFVLGNIDTNEDDLRGAIEAANQFGGNRFWSMTLADRRIAVLHGDDSDLLQQTIASAEWDLICHGHTHQLRQTKMGGTLVLNPGAIYRASPPTIALVELKSMAIQFIAI